MIQQYVSAPVKEQKGKEVKEKNFIFNNYIPYTFARQQKLMYKENKIEKIHTNSHMFLGKGTRNIVL